MSINALFQLGIVSVALNTTQTEERFSRSERHLIAGTKALCGRRFAGMSTNTSSAPQQRFVLPHTMQTQVYSGRMPI